MTFSKTARQVAGLKFLTDALNIQSTPGRHHLLKLPFMVDAGEINYHLSKVQLLKGLHDSALNNDATTKSLLLSLHHAISEVHDINGTLHALLTGSVLDDISLYEVKKFALISNRIETVLAGLRCEIITLADLSGVIGILDPEKQKVAHFYIYDAYSGDLKELRRQFVQCIQNDPDKAEAIRLQTMELEDSIREKLAEQLRPFAMDMMANLKAIAELDVWNAKAELAVRYNLVMPVVEDHQAITTYIQLFNPEIAETLKQSGKAYQSTDISIAKEPCLITGANMGGKTVLLKTIALAQYLCQFGFFVPAKEAAITPVSAIMTSIDDDQDVLKGLSSFASEMLKINDILQRAKNDRPNTTAATKHAHHDNAGNANSDKTQQATILALIDEPARTTNPAEGQAIVNALMDILIDYEVRSMITTHYGGILPLCRRLRVTGLRTELITAKPTMATINDYMDYSLIEIHPGKSLLSLMPQSKGNAGGMEDVPREAIRVASILDIDEDLLLRATEYLNAAKSE